MLWPGQKVLGPIPRPAASACHPSQSSGPCGQSVDRARKSRRADLYRFPVCGCTSHHGRHLQTTGGTEHDISQKEGTGEAPTRSVAGNVIRGSLGNLIEWYDWYAYAAFSIYFASVFFPSGNQTAQLLNTAGIFAVGFLIRPLGGWMLGRYADKFGRRAALTLSVTIDGHRFARHRRPAGICADRRTCADTAGRLAVAAGAVTGGRVRNLGNLSE